MKLKEIEETFKSNKKNYEKLKNEGIYILEEELKNAGIKTHSITSRIKELESFMEKIERKQYHDKPFDSIQDIIGLRVVCLFVSDIALIGDIIKEHFVVISEDNKIDGCEVSSFGYMSVHFIVKIKEAYTGHRYNSIKNIPFEIQVRTIAMDSWASVSHYLDYKSDADVPKELKRDFYALSGLFYVADKHFELFMQSKKKSQAEAVRILTTSNNKHQDINLDTLTAYLNTEFYDRGSFSPSDASELLNELVDFDITTIEQLVKMKEIAWNTFLTDEKKDPPHNARMFNPVGVIRGLLEITNEEYLKSREYIAV